MTRFFLGSLNHAGPYFHGTGEGLTTCQLDETTGVITRLHICPEAENVIWITRAGSVLWVATEHYLDPGKISAFAVDKAGIPARVGRPQSSHGGAICHIAVTLDERTAFVSSYLGGVSVHKIKSTGEVSPAHQVITYEGSGPDPDRQEKSHPHQAIVSTDGRRLFVCDLGADTIWMHPINGVVLGVAQRLPMPPGCGPRHLIFHPVLPRLYLMGELDAKLHVYELLDDELRLLTSHDTLPRDFSGVPAGAAIKFHPSSKALMVSNRCSDTITIFTVDAAGDLAQAACFSSAGKTPRDFAISPSGRWLLVVNQDSHAVVPFELYPDCGLPTGVCGQTFACGSPFCAHF